MQNEKINSEMKSYSFKPKIDQIENVKPQRNMLEGSMRAVE